MVLTKSICRALLFTWVGFSFTACKSLSDAGSGTKSAISFNGQNISLDQYIANQADYDGMKAEFRAMAQNHGGLPNYDDGVASIQARKPVFETLPGQTLSMEEQVALLVWTTGSGELNSPFQLINRALRSATAADDAAVASTVKTLASAINKLKGTPCQGVRGDNSLPQSLLLIEKAQVYKDKGFKSFGNGGTPPAPFDKMSIWTFVTSPNCKNIAPFSKYPNEAEILFPPGADFSVKDNYASATVPRVILLTHDGGPAPSSTPVLLPDPAPVVQPVAQPSQPVQPPVSIGSVSRYQVFPGLISFASNRPSSCSLSLSNGRELKLRYMGKPKTRCTNCGVFYYDDYYLVEWGSNSMATRVSLFSGAYLEGV